MASNDPGTGRQDAVGELHLPEDPSGADQASGRWSARNLPLAAGALVVMVLAIGVILVIAFQLVPE